MQWIIYFWNFPFVRCGFSWLWNTEALGRQTSGGRLLLRACFDSVPLTLSSQEFLDFVHKELPHALGFWYLNAIKPKLNKHWKMDLAKGLKVAFGKFTLFLCVCKHVISHRIRWLCNLRELHLIACFPVVVGLVFKLSRLRSAPLLWSWSSPLASVSYTWWWVAELASL